MRDERWGVQSWGRSAGVPSKEGETLGADLEWMPATALRPELRPASDGTLVGEVLEEKWRGLTEDVLHCDGWWWVM